MAERRTWAGAIRSATDVRTVLGSTNRRALERATTTPSPRWFGRPTSPN